jgi:hypothetical protein
MTKESPTSLSPEEIITKQYTFLKHYILQLTTQSSDNDTAAIIALLQQDVDQLYDCPKNWNEVIERFSLEKMPAIAPEICAIAFLYLVNNGGILHPAAKDYKPNKDIKGIYSYGVNTAINTGLKDEVNPKLAMHAELARCIDAWRTIHADI